MGGENHDPILSQRVDQIAEPHPLPGVQPSGGLVQDQQLRVVQHGYGDAHPLEHPAGELLHFFVRSIPKSHCLQQVVNAAVRLPLRDALEGGGIPEELPGRVAGIVPELLGEIPQQAPVFRPQGPDVFSLPQDLSLGGEQQGGEHLDEGGLARPIGCQQTVDAGSEGQGNVLQSGELPIGFRDVLNGEHRRRLLPSGAGRSSAVPKGTE